MSSWRRSGMAVVLGLVTLALGACTGPDRGDDDARGVLGDLRWRRADVSVICDGTARKAGTVEQAEPGEVIEFASPLPIEVPAGEADAEGHYPLMWTCGPEEASLRWDLTATGADSGRRVQFTIVGAPTPVDERPIAVDLYTESVVCDGTRTEVGVVGGLEPGENVAFESDQDGDSANLKAAGDGTLLVGWRCRPPDVDQTWEVTVTAVDSGRTTTFRLTGLPGAPRPDVAIESAEVEVRCDGQVRPLATLINFFPFEPVSFIAEPTSPDLRDGSADGAGRIELHWQCERDDVGKTWDLTARGTETETAISLTFTGVAGDPVAPATVRLTEDPFVCDGLRRPVAELSDLAPGEFVDFTSPQAELLREGRATPGGGTLEVNWQCDPSELDGADTKIWELTATGRESQRSVTFTITGILPAQP